MSYLADAAPWDDPEELEEEYQEDADLENEDDLADTSAPTRESVPWVSPRLYWFSQRIKTQADLELTARLLRTHWPELRKPYFDQEMARFWKAVPRFRSEAISSREGRAKLGPLPVELPPPPILGRKDSPALRVDDLAVLRAFEVAIHEVVEHYAPFVPGGQEVVELPPLKPGEPTMSDLFRRALRKAYMDEILAGHYQIFEKERDQLHNPTISFEDFEVRPVSEDGVPLKLSEILPSPERTPAQIAQERRERSERKKHAGRILALLKPEEFQWLQEVEIVIEEQNGVRHGAEAEASRRRGESPATGRKRSERLRKKLKRTDREMSRLADFAPLLDREEDLNAAAVIEAVEAQGEKTRELIREEHDELFRVLYAFRHGETPAQSWEHLLDESSTQSD